ncbi:MAG TPA: ComF family protein [Thermoanaerobaculia bacterium]
MPAEEVYDVRPPGVAPEHPEQIPRGWRDRLLAAVLPAACLSCGEPLPASAELGLCAPCRGRLRPLGGEGCGVCALCAAPLGAAVPAGYACGRCRARPPAFDRLLALWSYEPPLDAVVRGLKFGRLDYLGRHLGRELAAAFLAELGGVDLVVPVPLHWRRRLARGYNQAERIAGPLALALGRPLVPALSRRRSTPPQSALGRPQRLANPRGAFRVRRRHAVAGRAVLVVDDVATTGATLDAAAAALKRAGAAAVLATVAGRTPGP